MQVEVSATPPSDWDAYVERHPSSSAYHRSAAVLIGNKCFGLFTRFIVARRDDGTIAGILPIVEQSSWFLGRFMTSLPFVTYGGVLSDCNESAGLLVSSAEQLARERGCKHVELRHIEKPHDLTLPERLDKVSMVLALPDDKDALFASFTSKHRSQIRRGDREKPVLEWGGKDLLPEFYEIFSVTMHALGTPVYPPKFFEVVLAALQELAAVCIVRVEGKPVAAAITIRHGLRTEVTWAGATLWAKRNSINMRMYWELLQRSVSDGATEFDFGRTTVGSGTYRFKSQWGTKPMQLHWQYWLPEGAAVPVLNHSNPKYERVVRLWQKMPLWCVNRLGPFVSRSLP